jgi:hypothetical protein
MSALASGTVRIEWGRRVAAEYAVCLLAQDFAQRLTEFAAPPDLIEGALKMALDELEHARLAKKVHETAGADEVVTFDPTTFLIATSADPAVHIAAVAVPNLCLGETLALRIVHHLHGNAIEPRARAALDRVVRDEPRHAALGWETLDWLLDSPSEHAVRENIENELPTWITNLRDAFAGPKAEPHLLDLAPDDFRWGLAPPDTHRAIFEQTLQKDWQPRLARRGFQLP